MIRVRYGKRAVSAALCAALIFSVTACGSADSGSNADSDITSPSNNDTEKSSSSEAPQTYVPDPDSNEPYVLPDGMYFSEFTGVPISEEIKNQRPIAVMVDNEVNALPHYETTKADVVYELMNSTHNERITRLMCIVKDWGSIQQMGNIRSTRPTNIILAAEWNAILCHDGGPAAHNTYFFNKDCYKDHISGKFSRVNNGKSQEYTEYILEGDLKYAIEEEGLQTTYNEYANEGSHFNFVGYGEEEIKLNEKYPRSYQAFRVTLPFAHNSPYLILNPETGLYEYYEYGEKYIDASNGEPLAFKNIIIQKCEFAELDENGYLIYNCIFPSEQGWYLTNGIAKDITWAKNSDTDVTRYYDENGEELKMNTGKTYITLVPDDSWERVIFE